MKMNKTRRGMMHSHSEYVASQWNKGFRYGKKYSEEDLTDPLLVHYNNLTKAQRKRFN